MERSGGKPCIVELDRIPLRDPSLIDLSEKSLEAVDKLRADPQLYKPCGVWSLCCGDKCIPMIWVKVDGTSVGLDTRDWPGKEILENSSMK